MGPVAVVVLDVLVDDSFEMSTTEDEHPAQTFTPDTVSTVKKSPASIVAA
jgi:hypothetical protein